MELILQNKLFPNENLLEPHYLIREQNLFLFLFQYFLLKPFLQLLGYSALYLMIKLTKINKSTCTWQTESFSSLTFFFRVLKHYGSGRLCPHGTFNDHFDIDYTLSCVPSSCDLWLPIFPLKCACFTPAKKQPVCFVFWSWSLSLKFSLLLHFIFYQQEARFRKRTLFFWWWYILSEFAQHLKLQAETVGQILSSNCWALKGLFSLY